jgi:hypothetical protein
VATEVFERERSLESKKINLDTEGGRSSKRAVRVRECRILFEYDFSFLT